MLLSPVGPLHEGIQHPGRTMTTTELRSRAQRARQAANESRAAALERMEDATRRLRRAQELRALSRATLTMAAAEAAALSASPGVAEVDAAPLARFESARQGTEHLHDHGAADLALAPEVRLFVSERGGMYRVRCTPFEANPAEGEARQEMRAIVFETLEGRWIGSVPVHPSCSLDHLSDRELGAFLAFAR